MMPETTTEAPERALFVLIGTALFGTQWQEDMARALGISGRSVRYWLAGRQIPAGVWRDLLAVIDRKRRELAEIKVQAARQDRRPMPS